MAEAEVEEDEVAALTQDGGIFQTDQVLGFAGMNERQLNTASVATDVQNIWYNWVLNVYALMRFHRDNDTYRCPKS